jgi:hypothetical protein
VQGMLVRMQGEVIEYYLFGFCFGCGIGMVNFVSVSDLYRFFFSGLILASVFICLFVWFWF